MHWAYLPAVLFNMFFARWAFCWYQASSMSLSATFGGGPRRGVWVECAASGASYLLAMALLFVSLGMLGVFRSS